MSIPDIYSAPLAGLTEAEIQRLGELDPKLFSEIARRMEFEQLELDREMYEDSLIAFFERAWREIDPAQLSINWHHRVIADALQNITFGLERNLIINIPPRPVSEDALVPCREKGLVPLREISVGDFVLTHRRRWRRVDAVHLQGELDCLRIRTRRGREVEVAPDHPFLTPDGWVEAWTLRAEDVVGVVPGRPCGEATISEEEARLLGYLIGDGSVSHGTASVTAKSDLVARDVERCAGALGFLPKQQSYPGSTRQVSITAGRSTRPYTRVSLNGQHPEGGRRYKGYKGPVRQWLAQHDLEGKNSYTKRVPQAILRGDDAIVRAFLGAYWSCDGFVSSKGTKRDGTERDDITLGCDSVSRELLSDMQHLLTRLGVGSILRTKTAKLKTKRQGDIYTSYSLTITSQDDAARFARQIIMAHEKDDRLRKARRRRFDFDHDIWGETVLLNEKIGKRPCRCLTVADDHSFVANGFAVRNTGKTILANVIWPAWTWTQTEIGPLSGPQVSFLCVSYGATLAEEIALKMRRLVMGDWYQSLWGSRVRLRDDQTNRANFENTQGGARISNSIEGGILGRGASVRIVDDPQTRRGADSEAQRLASLQGMSDLTTRITDPRTSAQVLIMQRLHENDATDWALKNWPRDTVHLMFPARFDPSRACPVDPRRYEGELLWPEVWSEEELVKVERGLQALDGEVLSDFAVSGQLQQAPTPRGGGIINQDDWQMWPEWVPKAEDMTVSADGSAFVPLPPVSHVILSLDTALSEKETADWSACLVIGVWHRPSKLVTIVGSEEQIDDGEQPRAILMGGWRRRCKLNDPTLGRDGRPLGLVQLVADTCRRLPVDRIIIENKTRGLDVKNELQRQFAYENYNIQMFEPGRHGDKVARLHAVQPLFSQGLVYAPARCVLSVDDRGNEIVDVTEFEWVRNTIAEVAAVPRGTHDDLADCLSQGLLVLRDEGLLTLTQEYVRQQVAMRMRRPKRNSVRDGYGV